MSMQGSAPRAVAWTMPQLLAILAAGREPVIRALMEAVAEMVREIDPNGERDHRSHWDTTLKAQRRKPDLFDSIRFLADELIVLGAQLSRCDDLRIFCSLVEREDVPLRKLERYTPTVQLQRRWFRALQAASLPVAVRALRQQHDRALGALDLLGRLVA